MRSSMISKCDSWTYMSRHPGSFATQLFYCDLDTAVAQDDVCESHSTKTGLIIRSETFDCASNCLAHRHPEQRPYRSHKQEQELRGIQDGTKKCKSLNYKNFQYDNRTP